MLYTTKYLHLAVPKFVLLTILMLTETSQRLPKVDTQSSNLEYERPKYFDDYTFTPTTQ
jgi:hypothetical protein